MQRIFDGALEIARLARQALDWWLDELVGLLPDRWKNRRARIELTFGDTRVGVRLVRGDQIMGQGWVDEDGKTVIPPAFSAQIAKRKHNFPVWLLVPSDAVLKFGLQIPRSAYSNFTILLPLEIERRTPYRPDEILIGCKRVGQTDKSVDLELRYITRTLLTRLTSSITQSGLTPTIVVVGPDPEFRITDTNHRTAAVKAQIFRQRMSLAGLAAAILIFIAADQWSALKSKTAWQNQVDQDVQSLKRQQSLQKQLADLSTLIGSNGPSKITAAEILTSLATKLPPTDWLTEISFHNRVITLRGYAADTDLLIKQLEPLANNKIVSLQGETALDPRLSRQRFALSFQLEQASQ